MGWEQSMAQMLITGGTGFVGDALIPACIERGHQLTVLTRDPDRARKRHGAMAESIQYIKDIGAIETQPEMVVNLAGLGIADARWTDARKRALRSSRVHLTEQLVAHLATLPGAPAVVVSGSAVGYYGPKTEGVFRETDAPGWDFAARLCSDWEAAIMPLEGPETSIYRLRIGVVLGRPGGFLGRLEWPFRLGLGGPLGQGQQMLSWIHRDDLVRLILACLEGQLPPGAYNATAPNPVSNAAFTKALGRVLKRPTIFRVPEAPMRLVLGELASLLFEGQAVVPEAAMAEGFQFRHPDLDAALGDLFR